jgi:hypothetical protein
VGIRFRKTFKLGKNTKVNMSKSGISVSKKIGPFTFNSKGSGSVKLGKGLSYGFKWKKK